MSRDLEGMLGSPEFTRDPYPTLRRLREEAPVYWCESWSSWLISRYADVDAVVRDWDSFSNAGRVTRTFAGWPDSIQESVAPLREFFDETFLNSDPPKHTRIRRLMNQAFHRHAIDNVRALTFRLVDELLDEAISSGELDAVEEIAVPLPVMVLSNFLGLPEDDAAKFKAWSDTIVGFIGAHVEDLERAGREAVDAYWAAREWLRDIFEERRRRPTSDLLTTLVEAEEHGEKLTESELVGTCITLMVGGHETTTNLIANGLLALAHHEGEYRRLVAGEIKVETAVEEFLRYDGPFIRQLRVTSEDVELHGVRIPRGSSVSVMLSAADRDERQFRRPDELDLSRQPNRHLAFGRGIHFCIGAPLARMEAQIFFAGFAQRVPHFEVRHEEVSWAPNNQFRLIDSLPVSLMTTVGQH